MEETRPVQIRKTMLPNTAQGPLPQTNPLRPGNNNDVKKRKPSDVDMHHSAYFKIVALVQQLRSHFIEALQTPDFRNCKAAYEIRKRMKLVMDLYKQMQTEGNPTGSYEDRSKVGQPLSGEKKLEKEHLDGLCQGDLEHLQHEYVLKKSPEKELSPAPVSSGQKFNKGQSQGSYIVGGSVFGWNFITFANRKPPVYCGVTKESYKCTHSRSEKGNSRLGTPDGSNDKKSPL